MSKDIYHGFADRYDWMRSENPERMAFFRQLFINYNVTRLLDCACGTGQDLIMFHKIGLSVQGSDLSEAMLTQTRRNLERAGVDIPFIQADFRELADHFKEPFQAVVCLSNSINEPLEDAETMQTLQNMHALLCTGGILVFDQGQTDASMKNPPPFVPILNNRDHSRLFTIEYSEKIQTVNIFDFSHTEKQTDFQHTAVKIRIRLMDSWQKILREAGFSSVDFFGDWKATPYDKNSAERLIAVAQK